MIFVLPRGLGYVLPDGLIYVLQIAPDGKVEKTRIPDVSFLRGERIPADFDDTLPFHGAPDFAIEIVSSNEGENRTLAKVRDYLAFGTEEMWVLYSDVEEAHQYLRDDPKTVSVYSGDDGIESVVFPDLRLRAADLFALPTLTCGKKMS